MRGSHPHGARDAASRDAASERPLTSAPLIRRRAPPSPLRGEGRGVPPGTPSQTATALGDCHVHSQPERARRRDCRAVRPAAGAGHGGQRADHRRRPRGLLRRGSARTAQCRAPVPCRSHTSFTGAAAETVDREITSAIEGAVARVQGVASISSCSSYGRSRVTLTFADGTNLDNATSDVRDALARIAQPAARRCRTPRPSSRPIPTRRR